MRHQARDSVHYAELRPLPDSDPSAADWNAYLRELPRLLADGQEGRHVLIKDGQIIGLYDTWEEARAEGVKRYLLQPMLVKQLLTREPLLHIRGYDLPWPT